MVDRFASCGWRPGATRVPLRTACAAWLEGRVLSITGVGDHGAVQVAGIDGGAGRS